MTIKPSIVNYEYLNKNFLNHLTNSENQATAYLESIKCVTHHGDHLQLIYKKYLHVLSR